MYRRRRYGHFLKTDLFCRHSDYYVVVHKPHFARLSYKFCSQHCFIVLIYGLDKEIVRDTGRQSDCTEWTRTALTNNATTSI